MKSKEEIEKYLGKKIKSNNEQQTRDSSYAMSVDMSRYVSKEQQSYTVTVKVLSEESEKALKSLLKDSIEKGDLETAATCHSILLEESTFYKNHPNAIGLDINEVMALKQYEAEQKTIAEEQARLKVEQEAKEKTEEQARLKAEQEAKEKAEEQARLKAEQEAKEKAEKQARLKAEQEEKERQASIEKDIAEYEQYEELISRKPELDKLFNDLYYEDFSVAVDGHISERMVDLLDDLKKLPDNERKIILQRYNGLADLTINEQGQVIKDGIVQDLPKRKSNEQENTQEEQIEVEISDDELEEQFAETTSGLDYDKMMEEDLEYMRTHKTYQPSQVVEEYWNRVNSQQAKEYEQQQPEKIRPREESIRDTIGDEKDRQSKMQMQEVKTPTVDLWMNRFDSWYSAIDRVSQNVEAKFVKMKLDIVNAISTEIKERMNKREINTQEQDSSER